MNEQEIRAIVRDECAKYARVIAAGWRYTTAAEWLGIDPKDLEARASGGAPGARGEETAAPTSNPEPPTYEGPRSPAYLQTAPTYIGMDGRKHFRGSEDQYPPAPTLGGVAILSSPSAPEHLMASAVGDPYDWKEAAPTSPAAWTEEQRQAAYDLAFEARPVLTEDGEGGTVEGVDAASDAFCAAIARIAPLFAPPKPAPSVEDCERAYIKAWAESLGGEASDATCHERAGIAAVRALMLESNKGDGGSTEGRATGRTTGAAGSVSASGDDGSKPSPVRLEPESGIKPGTPPPFTPDREALYRITVPHGVEGGWRGVSDAAFDYFAPLIAERDALRARIAELEARKPTVTRDQVASMAQAIGQSRVLRTSAAEQAEAALRAAGIEVTP